LEQIMSKSWLVAALMGSLSVAACVEEPPPRQYYRHAQPVASAPRFQEVIAYPARGQSAEQLDRDRYDCHRWAAQQTGFDPVQMPASAPSGPPSQAPIPGSGVTVGALAGAVLGSIIAPRGSEGGGAIIGAITGGAVGAATENAERAQAERDRAVLASTGAGQQAERSGAYRRALSACLEGRGYSVK
jgi:hypothetical protein